MPIIERFIFVLVILLNTSDKWCEQGGAVLSAATFTITFKKEFVDTNYSIYVTPNANTSLDSNSTAGSVHSTKTESKCNITVCTAGKGGYWLAKGFII